MSPESLPHTPTTDPNAEAAQQLEAQTPTLQVEESDLAVHGLDSAAQEREDKLEDKVEKLTQGMAFTKALGAVALKRAAGGKISKLEQTQDDESEEDSEEVKERKAATPQTFIQRQQAKRAFKKADALHEKRLQDEIKLDIYGPSMGKNNPVGAPLRMAKTVALRHKLKQNARSEFLAGNISRSKRDQLLQVAGMTKAESDFTQADLDERHEKRLRKLEKKLQSPILQEVRRTRIQSANRKIDELNGISPYDRLTDVLFPNVQEQIESAPDTTEVEAVAPVVVTETTPAAPKRKKTGIEILLEKKAAGLLPEVPEVPVVAEEATSPEAETPVEAESTPATPVAAAEKPKGTELDQDSVEKMAELAYLTAKEEVFRLIDEEEAKRTKEGSPALSKEEKAELWKRERGIRQQLLGTLSDENRSLVNKQIGELIGADKKARAAGEKQLLQKRRDEAKAAERKAAADKKAAAKAAKEAEAAKQKAAAAAVNRNAAQTAIDS